MSTRAGRWENVEVTQIFAGRAIVQVAKIEKKDQIVSIKEAFMDQQMFTINFDNSSVADANRWASDLKECILDATDEVEVEQKRDNPYSQDLGATLSLVLGAPAIVAVAQALGNWLLKHRDAGISIRTPQGEIVASNLTSKDVMKLAEMLLAQKGKE